MKFAPNAMPLKVVIDTNLTLGVAAQERGLLREAWRKGVFEWITSEPLIVEFLEVATRIKLQRYLSLERAEKFVVVLHANATFVMASVENLPPCRDPNDLPLIGTAIAGQAEYLVTSDKDVLDDSELVDALAAYRIKVLSGSQFLSLIEAEG
jgi:putative PIN family toxin of toxin-antitoxin system